MRFSACTLAYVVAHILADAVSCLSLVYNELSQEYNSALVYEVVHTELLADSLVGVCSGASAHDHTGEFFLADTLVSDELVCTAFEAHTVADGVHGGTFWADTAAVEVHGPLFWVYTAAWVHNSSMFFQCCHVENFGLSYTAFGVGSWFGKHTVSAHDWVHTDFARFELYPVAAHAVVHS